MENKQNKCEIPFWKDPKVLYQPFNLEYRRDCKMQLWNLIARIGIIALLSGIILSTIAGVSAIPVILVFASVLILSIIFSTHLPPQSDNVLQSQQIQQPHQSTDISKPATFEFVTEGFDTQEVLPTSRNPFMNVLADEFGADRKPAAKVDNPTVKQTFDDYFRVQWFSDPTDVYGKNQGQRQFITQPSTSVPNDRKSFQDWLYKIPGKTCKEGGRALCKPGTDGSPITRLNQDL